jgi:molybdopterin-guanine dinucleotide biosynthesis protein A
LNIGCIILAGGKGRRFGRDKAWVELGGQSLLQRAVSNLEILNTEIIIVRAQEQELPLISAQVQLKVVTDTVYGKGPLAGIYAGLANSASSYNLVVACDMPFINQALVKYMIEAVPGYDIAVPRLGATLEPLQAVYSRRCLGEIEELLSVDELKVDCLFGRVRTRYIDSAEIERFDPQYLSFLNINTRDDLVKAGGFLGRS